jgi:hypothetical protein
MDSFESGVIPMRFCFPGWFGPRHAGLGNELIPLAKAFIASTELDIKLLPTAWGLNDRGYRIYFDTSRFDWLRLYGLSKALPAFTFRESDYLATGEKDYDKAIRVYAERMGLYSRKNYVLMTDGLWGEFYALRKAKPFIWRTLHGTRYTTRNLYDFQKRIDGAALLVAVNIRMADFAISKPETDFRGLWNTRIPLEWYSNICRNLRQTLGEAISFVLITDGTEDELRDFILEFQPITTFDFQNAVVSNLLILASADALICSISSYSQWAAFLSNSPYFWYQPHLQTCNEYLTIWNEFGEPPRLKEAMVHPRGIPVGDSGDVPPWLVEYLETRIDMGRTSLDLVRGGGVPESMVTSCSLR